MNTYKKHIFYGLFLVTFSAVAQNPLITDQFTADPTARVFGDRIYVYPSHDVVPPEGEGRAEWFNMADYHVFSSDNLTKWTDHGVILDQKDVPWADPKAYSMWAPDAIEKDGKYYFYFPTRRKGAETGEAGFSIGIAIADNPEGSYVPQAEPMEGVVGIDPNVFIDKDGQAYFYWSRDKIYGAKLKENMFELASEPKIFDEIPKKGHVEGPFVFEREGTYYLTYPHVANNTERLEYATGKDPLGPFTHRGVIMDESPTEVWTNHHSVVKFKDQWYLFYHHNELSPDFDKNRSIMADSLHFNPDGTIQKVEPTLRGIGLTNATDQINIDRYSDKSGNADIAFNDPDDTFQGWHTILEGPEEWIQYNSVSFSADLKAVKFRAASEAGGTLQLRLNDRNGKLISEVNIPQSTDWNTVEAEVKDITPGEHHLVLISKEGSAKVDWVKFED